MLDLKLLAEELNKASIETKFSLQELRVGFYKDGAFITIANFYNESKGTVLAAFTPAFTSTVGSASLITRKRYARFDWFGAYLNKWDCDCYSAPLDKATEAELVKFLVEPYYTFMHTLVYILDKESAKARHILTDLGLTERALPNTYELKLIDGNNVLRGATQVLCPRVRPFASIACAYDILMRKPNKEIIEQVSYTELDDVVAFLLGDNK